MEEGGGLGMDGDGVTVSRKISLNGGGGKNNNICVEFIE